MASGLFLGGPSSPKPVPFLGAQSTRLAEDYCFTLFRSYATEESFIGSSQQPFFSYLSVYTELGITAIVALVVFVMKLLRRVQRAARDRPQVRVQALVVTSGSIFLLLLGLQENYWEMPQAILVGVLLLKVVYANVMYPEADEVTGTS